MNKLIDYWYACHKENVPDFFLLSSPLKKEERQAFVSSLGVTVYGKFDSFRESKFSFHEAFFKKILEINKNAKYFVSFLKESLSDDGLKIESPITGSYIESNSSFSSQLVSFIRYYDSGEVFYLIQNHQSFAGVYFPLKKVYITFAGGSVKGYLDFLVNIIFNRNDFYISNIAEREKKLVYLVSCPRPWHYYYNSLSGFLLLEKNSALLERSVVSVPGGDFFDLNGLEFIQSISIKSVDGKNLLNSNNVFVFTIGCSFESLGEDEHLLVKQAVNKTIKIDIEKQCDIKIWVGITGQKRSWIEQEGGIAKAVNMLAERFHNLVVVVDGWTSPLTKSKNDFLQIESDNKVFNSLLLKINKNVVVKNIIGHTSQQKIKEALDCDFFIANYASGSLHVARFAGIPGLSHLNNSMPRKHHVHSKTVEVSYSLVKDIKEEGKKGHHLSYSIHPDDFLMEFSHFFNNLKIDDFKRLRADKNDFS